MSSMPNHRRHRIVEIIQRRIVPMQHKQRIFLGLAVIVLGTLLLSGCAKATTAPVAANLTGEITVWMWQPAKDPIVNSGVEAEFYAKYPNIKINWVVYGPNDVYP